MSNASFTTPKLFHNEDTSRWIMHMLMVYVFIILNATKL